MIGHVHLNQINDDVSYLQVSDSQEVDSQFFTFAIDDPIISFTNNFPSDYVITGLRIYRNFDLRAIERETYDLLAFLGDVGGLHDMLIILGSLCVS